jgi:hypothetical protein
MSKTLSIQTNALLATALGDKHAQTVLNQVCQQSITRTAKTCGVNGVGGMPYIKEVPAYFNTKEGKTSSYASKGLLASIEVLASLGAEIGKSIFNSEPLPCDLVTLQNKVIMAYSEAITNAKAKKAEGKAIKEAETAQNTALTEQALQDEAQATGMTVIDAFALNDNDYVLINDEAVLFADLKNAYITMQARALIESSNLLTPIESEAKQSA